MSAQANLFSAKTITSPVGASVLIVFENKDAVPHNIAIYETPAAEREVYVGETFAGPDKTIEYKLTAPLNPQVYFLRCDVHPIEMTGKFVIE